MAIAVCQCQHTALENLAANTYFFDKDTHRLYVWLADGSDPNQHLMEMTKPAGCGINASYVKFSGLKILNSGLGGGVRRIFPASAMSIIVLMIAPTSTIHANGCSKNTQYGVASLIQAIIVICVASSDFFIRLRMRRIVGGAT